MMPWFLSHVLLLLGFTLAIPVIAQMLRQRRSPAASLAWLLIIALVPYLGIPLYLALGGRKMRRLADKKAALQMHDQALSLPDATRGIDRLLRSYGIPGACDGNRMKLCTTGEEGYDALVEMITQARQSIWVSTFILHPDTVGRAIIDQLSRRAAAGVEVRVLLDGVGSLHTRQSALAPLTLAGGEVAFFMPVLHKFFRGRTNLRNHRKAIMVDGSRVWAGGANIATEYIGPVPETSRWRDLSFLLEGPAAQHYLNIFRSDWRFATGKHLAPMVFDKTILGSVGEATLQVVPSGPDVSGDPLYAALVSAVFSASHRIWIVTPYFVPDETLNQALHMAVHRGVEVKILLPEKSNHRLADLARGPYLRDLQDAGGKIYLYRGGMMHGKALLTDDTLAVIGSANFDMRSLFLNYETGLLIHSQPEIKDIHSWVEQLAKNCQCGVTAVGTLRDLCEGVAHMMAPML